MGTLQCYNHFFWIIYTLSLQIAQSTMYTNNVKDLLEDLKERLIEYILTTVVKEKRRQRVKR